MQALVLAGGFGTRLAHIVKDVPKPMADVAGKPFLEYLVEYLRNQGVTEVVFLTGYKSEAIEGHFGNGHKFGLTITYSVEREPLGTGGAVWKAARMLKDDLFFLVNGDTYFNVDLQSLAAFHSRSGALLSLSLKYMPDTKRYGSARLNGYQIVDFAEKADSLGEGYINGGVYCIGRQALEAYHPKGAAFSFEKDVMPVLLDQKGVYGVPFGGRFIDIGVPEDYAKANAVLPSWISELRIKAAFLDRDGVINVDTGYAHKLEDLKLMDGVEVFLKGLQKLGYSLIIVTNQAGVAKGKFSIRDYEVFQKALLEKLYSSGVSILDSFYCPFHPAGNVPEFSRESLLRKPEAGMLLLAADKYSIDLAASVMVGDKDSDRIKLPYLKNYILKGRYELQDTLPVYQGFDQILEDIKNG